MSCSHEKIWWTRDVPERWILPEILEPGILIRRQEANHRAGLCAAARRVGEERERERWAGGRREGMVEEVRMGWVAG